MWQARSTEIKPGRVVQYRITENERELTMDEVIQYWINDGSFRQFYNTLLAQNDFSAFFWEHPAVTEYSLYHSYEFVLINTKLFEEIHADIGPFSSYFVTEREVVAFANVRGDAQLVVPTPKTNGYECYTHLASFTRQAPSSQIDAFWQAVGKSYISNIGNVPKWLSTSGLGVHWLHVRIDSRPKYYQYSEYRKPR